MTTKLRLGDAEHAAAGYGGILCAHFPTQEPVVAFEWDMEIENGGMEI